MKTRRLLLSPFVAGLVFLISLASARAEEPARLVPHDVAVYVELSNPQGIVDRLLAPDMVATLESIPQFKQFKQSDQYAQFQAVVAYVEAKLGTDWRSAVTGLSGGGAVLAIKPGSPDYALVVMRAKDAGLLQRTHDLLVQLVEDEAKKQGKESPVKSKEYKGVTAWSLGKDEFHAMIGDTLILSNKQDGLKAAIETHAGEGPKSIADLEMFREAKERQPSDRVGWAFVRLDMLKQAGVAKEFYQEKASNAAIPLLFGGLNHVLANASYMTGAIVLNEERFALRFEVPRDGNAWPEQYRGFYAEESGKEAAEPLRPTGTLASLSVYRDLKAMWDAREKLVAPEVLPQFTELESNVGQLLFGGREFANEVLGEIGPRIRFVAAAQDFSKAQFSPDIKIPAFAMVLELKNPKEFGTELLVSYQSIMGLANIGLAQQNQPRFIVKTEPHKNYQIHAARFLERPTADSPESAVHIRHNFSPSCSVAGRYFIVGSTVQIVKDVIDALDDPNAAPKTTKHNVILELDTAQIIDVLKQNREPLVHQNMVENGNTREQAERELDVLFGLLGLFGPGQATWTADSKSMHIDLSIEFAKPQKAAK